MAAPLPSAEAARRLLPATTGGSRATTAPRVLSYLPVTRAVLSDTSSHRVEKALHPPSAGGSGALRMELQRVSLCACAPGHSAHARRVTPRTRTPPQEQRDGLTRPGANDVPWTARSQRGLMSRGLTVSAPERK